MQAQFDQRAVHRSFAVGDKVLIFAPQCGVGLSALFCGTYTLLKKVETDIMLSVLMGIGEHITHVM